VEVIALGKAKNPFSEIPRAIGPELDVVPVDAVGARGGRRGDPAYKVASEREAAEVQREAAPQGQTERGPEHARSICSFSGLNDFDEEEQPPYDRQVQSYGQLVKQGYKGTEFAPPPGVLCNPNTGPSGPFTGPVE
jgi:hypothetical protein